MDATQQPLLPADESLAYVVFGQNLKWHVKRASDGLILTEVDAEEGKTAAVAELYRLGYKLTG